jgi:putative transposase
MSLPDRRAMIDPAMIDPVKSDLSVRRQGELLALARSGVYRPKSATAPNDLAPMRRIDELHPKPPFYGSRRMMFELDKQSPKVNRKHVQRRMRLMGMVARVPCPGTSKSAA